MQAVQAGQVYRPRIGAQSAFAAQIVIVLEVAERQLAQRAVYRRAEAQSGEVRLGNASPQAAFAVDGDHVVKPVTVWKKTRRAGLWVNTQSITFDGVPNYYAVLSTKPLNEIASLEVRKEHDIGVDALQFPSSAEAAGKPLTGPSQEFRDGLINLKLTSGLFVENNQAAIDFLGARLFRARVFLPPAAGPGLYRANFYVFQKGSAVGEASAHIRLNKIGIEASLSSTAVNHPWLYGVLAVLLAAGVGGGASLAFRRG